MARRRTPGALLAGKQSRLDWSTFNLLENLLVFCAHPSRAVPRESGVHFQIGSTSKDRAVCVLFQIDRRRDPLIQGADIPRPDFLVLYATRDRCICTIVEMKGRDGKKLEHGIEQIRALRDLLRREIAEHLPNTCKSAISFQGILLTPLGSQIPGPRLEKEKKNGLTIIALQYQFKAELQPYVSKLNQLTEKYEHQALRPDEFNYVERLLVHRALPSRIGTVAHTRRRAGLHVDYADEAGDEHVTLVASNEGASASFSSAAFQKKVAAELARLGLKYRRLELRLSSPM
jgi:hypothetical protein